MTSKSDIPIGVIIRDLRKKRGLAQIQLSKQAGIDPRTLAAIEKGRIATPSLPSLKQISTALGIPLKELFGKTEAGSTDCFFLGNQRGEYTMEWPKQHFRIISYLPKSCPLFAGKIVLENRGQCDSKIISFPRYVFFQIIFGKVEFNLEGNEYQLKEGQHLFFDGRLSYSMQNPALREATALVLTQPSFLQQ